MENSNTTLSPTIQSGDDQSLIIDDDDTKKAQSSMNNNNNNYNKEYQRWLSRIKKNWRDIQWAPDRIRNNTQIILLAMQKSRGHALQFASSEIQDNKEFILNFVSSSSSSEESPKQKQKQHQYGKYFGLAFRNVSQRLKNDKDVVMAVVKQDGRAYQHVASQELQNDKDVIINAVKQWPDAIKFIPSEELKRDVDVLIAAKMLDEDHDDYFIRRQKSPTKSTTQTTTTTTKATNTTITRKIALSTRFSLIPSSDSEANKFTALFKNSEYIKNNPNNNNINFKIYAPNAFDKQTCDKKWTDFHWPCRGTKQTCRYKNKLTIDGHPTDDCCWRYSFRSQLQEAKTTNGFMLQLIEANHGLTQIMEPTTQQQDLGDGQRIELDMSKQVQCKVFQVYRPTHRNLSGMHELRFNKEHIDAVTKVIDRWYSEDCCCDMSVTVIRP